MPISSGGIADDVLRDAYERQEPANVVLPHVAFIRSNDPFPSGVFELRFSCAANRDHVVGI